MNNMSGSESDSTCDIDEEAAKALSTLLPDRSREKYQKAYNNFKAWCGEKKVTIVDEKVLLAYFSTVLKNSKSSTAMSIYSMLKSTLNLIDNVQISDFTNLRALLKKKSCGYNAKKSRIFKKGEVYRFIKEAPDAEFLAMKVMLIIGIYGALRRDEIAKLTVNDVEYMDNGIKITVPMTRKKMVRQFVVSEGDDSDVNLVKIVRKYAKLRPHDAPQSRFFLCYKQGKCNKLPIGINTVGSYPQLIATFLALPFANEYTGHSFRRSSAPLLADAGVEQSYLKCYSDNLAEGYVQHSSKNKRESTDHKTVTLPEANYSTNSTMFEATTCSSRSPNMTFNNMQNGLPIKIEKEKTDDYLVFSMPEDKAVLGTPYNEYSENRTISSYEMCDMEIKEEPTDDNDNSEYDEYTCEYLDEDSEAQQTQDDNAKSKKFRAKTSRAQFDKLIAFMRCHSDFNKRKRLETAETLRMDDAWKNLTADLNAIGPPVRTSAQWSRAWTNFKSNKKRRQAAHETNGEPGEAAKRMRFEILSDHYDVWSPLDGEDATNSAGTNYFARPAKHKDITNSETNNKESHFHSNILKKMDLVVEQQMKHTDQLDKLNKNLEKLIEVITEKFS